MIALLHSLKVVTFSTWSSLVVFGGVGLLVQPEALPIRPHDIAILDAEALDSIELNAEVDSDAGGSADIAQGSEESVAAPQDQIATPPPAPDFVELTPLPNLPAVTIAPAQAPQPAAETPRPVTTSSASVANRHGKPNGKGQTAFGQEGGKGMGEGTGTSTASGNGNSDRTRRRASLAIPKPSYPSSCRSSGITGTVKVLVKWDSDGQLVSAQIVQASPSPLLDDSAVKACSKARFPKGDPGSVIAPVRFTLE